MQWRSTRTPTRISRCLAIRGTARMRTRRKTIHEREEIEKSIGKRSIVMKIII